ncbi:MAG: CFI-box-CTERM domain-containing protein [Oligoflexales bacterium]
MRFVAFFFLYLSCCFPLTLNAQELSVTASGSMDPELSRIYITVQVNNIPNDQIASQAELLLNRQIELFFTGISKTKPIMINSVGIPLYQITSATWSPTAQSLAEATSNLSSLTVTGTIIPVDTWTDFSDLIADGESIAMAAVFVPYDSSAGQLANIIGTTLDLNEFSVPINWNKPIDAPEITETKSIHRGFYLRWSTPDEVSYSNVTVSSSDEEAGSTELGSQEEPFPSSVLAVSFPLSDAPTVFEAISFDPSTPKTGSNVSCSYVSPPSGTSDQDLKTIGWNCVDCTQDTATTQAYLPYITEDVPYTMQSLTSKAAWTKTGLSINVPYVAFLQYPKGLARTTCRLITTTENFTVSEINGGSAAVESDPRCFIATAAFGTPFSKELDTLRWFRDQYLLSSPVGREFVEFYYEVSPRFATWVSTSQIAQQVIRGFLYPVVWIIQLEQMFLGLTPFLLCSVFAAIYILRRRRYL